jgi:hypothetical protein
MGLPAMTAFVNIYTDHAFGFRRGSLDLHALDRDCARLVLSPIIYC